MNKEVLKHNLQPLITMVCFGFNKFTRYTLTNCLSPVIKSFQPFTNLNESCCLLSMTTEKIPLNTSAHIYSTSHLSSFQIWVMCYQQKHISGFQLLNQFTSMLTNILADNKVEIDISGGNRFLVHVVLLHL